MRLNELLESFDFDELMPVISDMFPGTSKFRKPLNQAFDMIINTRVVASKKTITYKIMHDDKNNQSYVGAEDRDFDATWEVCLGKELVRQGGVDLSQPELAANCFINLCFLSRYPNEFEPIHEQLVKQ